VALNNIKQTNNKQGIGSDYPHTVALVWCRRQMTLIYI